MLRLSELAKGDFLALDIEGDGNKNQRPVEISVCEFSHGAFVREHHWLINPERPISYFARVKHGIGDRKVRSAPKFTEVKEEIANFLAGSLSPTI
ncbi:3'-5' exonuclease [Rhizobium sp. 42MFCr.1]|jgi:DNA polymerase III epsilon subunit-like protein|uniref:3'-5' exonuclease n=1 Tax=Rhizobium sp. 42MFCr.1 TaxID=1048680 RepID=UPI000367D4AF|nr:exonuclease domain-containing protein [Rhizobium sp. 42MFCr.1]